MAFGFEIFDAAGNLRIGTGDNIARLIYEKIVEGGDSDFDYGTATVNDYDSSRGAHFAAPLEPFDPFGLNPWLIPQAPHYVRFNNSTKLLEWYSRIGADNQGYEPEDTGSGFATTASSIQLWMFK